MSAGRGIWRVSDALILIAVGVVVIRMATDVPSRTDSPPSQRRYFILGAANTAGLERADFMLGDVRYHILLPRGTRVQLPRGQVHSVTFWHPQSTRLLRNFTLGAALGESDARYAGTGTLSNGAVLRYNIDDDYGGGSGGAEAELKGRLEMGARALAVTCHDQSEWHLQPDWCVPYLHHLRIDGGS